MHEKFNKINLGITKSYILTCNEGYLLIDTGYSDKFERFSKKIKKLGIKVDSIKYLFLTHHHEDHAGFARELREKSGCKLIVHRSGIKHLEKGETIIPPKIVNAKVKISIAMFHLVHKTENYPPIKILKDDVVLDSDDILFLNSIGINGKILYTPGHSKDSISIVLSDGSAFVGDAAMNFLKFCDLKFRPIYIDDMDEVLLSWEKMIKEGAKVLYPAHGKPFTIIDLQKVMKK